MKRDTSALTSRPSALRRGAGAVGNVLGGLVRPLLKDRMSLFLIVASATLTILFFSLLDSTKPSSPGQGIPLSTMISISEEKQVVAATLLDQTRGSSSRRADGAHAVGGVSELGRPD